MSGLGCSSGPSLQIFRFAFKDLFDNFRLVHFLRLIETKRDGRPLTEAEIHQFVTAYTAGTIPDYQMAAFLMAVFFRGLTQAETLALTLAMRDSGRVLSFPQDGRPLVDKHSTGGVGDKVSLPLAPLLACLGFRVPMISGRGLGITGGTLDKLDSIPGFQTSLTIDRMMAQVEQVGCVICGQTADMVPADKGLYALRDVTGTVASIPLIVASILSKKLAEGLDALVLDVKFGAAAFMPAPDQAKELAQGMVSLARQAGLPVRALLTNMDSPLGRAAGNWLEVREAVACLEPATGGQSDPRCADVVELVLACAAHLLVQTGRHSTFQDARHEAAKCLASGAPRQKWDQMIAAQGADLKAFNRKLKLSHTAPTVVEVRTPRAGFLTRCDAKIVGEVIRDLGGGRVTKDSVLDYEVGIEMEAKPGEAVSQDAVLARIHAPNTDAAQGAQAPLLTAFELSHEAPPARKLITEIIQ